MHVDAYYTESGVLCDFFLVFPSENNKPGFLIASIVLYCIVCLLTIHNGTKSYGYNLFGNERIVQNTVENLR